MSYNRIGNWLGIYAWLCLTFIFIRIKALISFLRLFDHTLLDLDFTLACHLWDDLPSIACLLFFSFKDLKLFLDRTSIQQLVRYVIPAYEAFLLKLFNFFLWNAIALKRW